jgi:DUF1365 family protein
MGMDMIYDWRLNQPAEDVRVQIVNTQAGERCFHASLALRRRELTRWQMRRTLIRYPWMSAKVVAGIYFQALRLWLKKCPFYAHPAGRSGGAARQHVVTSR